MAGTPGLKNRQSVALAGAHLASMARRGRTSVPSWGEERGERGLGFFGESVCERAG